MQYLHEFFMIQMLRKINCYELEQCLKLYTISKELKELKNKRLIVSMVTS